MRPWPAWVRPVMELRAGVASADQFAPLAVGGAQHAPLLGRDVDLPRPPGEETEEVQVLRPDVKGGKVACCQLRPPSRVCSTSDHKPTVTARWASDRGRRRY